MRKTLTLLFILTALFSLAGRGKTDSRPIAFFFLEVCPGCESYQKAEELNGLVIQLTASRQYQGKGWNMGFGTDEASEELMRIIGERQLPDISYALPLLFMGDEYYVGYEDIEEALRGEVRRITGEG